MKYPLSLCLFSLLFACGETRIESVDDDTLEQATTEHEAAALKLQQADLLGTWDGCTKVSAEKAWNHEMVFTGDGALQLKRETYADAECKGDVGDVEQLAGQWSLAKAADEKPGFVLRIKVDGKAIDAEFKAGQFPRVFDLKDVTDLKLLELKSADKFVNLTRHAAGEAEAIQKKAEKKILDLLTTEMKREGVWRSDCDKGEIKQLEFTGEQTKKLVMTTEAYQEDDCKKLAEKQADPLTYTLTVDSVTNLDENLVQLTLTPADKGAKIKRTIGVKFDDLDSLIFDTRAFAFEVKK